MAKGLNGGNTLSYMGVNAPQPPNMTQHDRAPDVDDYQSFELGDFWINQAPTNPINHELYILVAKVNKQATWVMLYPNIGTASVISLNSLSGVLNLTTGDNISITPSGLNIALAVAGTAQYAIQVGNASGSLTSLGLGTAGQVLTSNGVGNFPIWQSLVSGVSSLNTLTGALTLLAGNNTVITPSGSDIYVGLTGLTNHCIQLGNSSGGLSSFTLGTSGAILQSQGNGSDPKWSIASYPSTVSKGDVLIASANNTVSTVSGAATSGYVLMANGAGTVPSFQSIPAAGIVTIDGNSGSVTGATVLISGSNNITTSGTATTLTLNLTGTTQYAIQTGSAAGALTSLPLGISNQVLTSNGAGAAPTWQATQNAVTSVSGTTNQITVSPTTGATVVSLVASPTVTGTWTTTAGNLALPTTSSTAGQITINGSQWAHAYGSANTFIGGSGNFTTSGTGNNIGAGGSCMQNLTTGSANCAYGVNSASVLTTGDHNCFYGPSSGAISFASGSLNSFYGAGSGSGSITSGSYNSFFGATTGSSYSSNESSNILIGYGTTGNKGVSNQLKIGSATGTGGGQLNSASICGITGKTSTSGAAVYVNSSNVLGTGTSSIRYKEDVTDMSDMSQICANLRPVTFHFKEDTTPKPLQYGLIAEEVETIWPEMVIYGPDGLPQNLAYQFLAPVLLKEVQKLNKIIIELTNRIKALEDK